MGGPFLEKVSCTNLIWKRKVTSIPTISASIVLSAIIHNEPTSFAGLQAAGVPAAFLNAVASFMPPSFKVFLIVIINKH
jgi:hypothetical protein